MSIKLSDHNSRYVILMLDFTAENVPALPAVEDPVPPLEVELAVVRLVGGLALEHHVAKVTIVRILQLIVLFVKWFTFLIFYA